MKALPLVVSLILVLKDVDGVPEPTHRDTDTQSTHKLGYTKKGHFAHKVPPQTSAGWHLHACMRSHTYAQTQ